MVVAIAAFGLIFYNGSSTGRASRRGAIELEIGWYGMILGVDR